MSEMNSKKRKLKKDVEPDVSALEYESLFDDARNMAFTLRKIDQELRIAAQCEGDHPGGYPLSRLLPELCKIMYSNIGNFKSTGYDLA